ncbi:MAG: alkaline phosphatase PhoX [Bauldia sp.]
MNPQSTRRGFLKALGTSGAGLTIAPLLAMNARAQIGPIADAGFGRLVAKLPLNSDLLVNELGDLRGMPVLALPESFDYWIISSTGDVLSDGVGRVPGAHDGMAAFRGPGGSTVLVRNHELGGSGPGDIRAVVPSGTAYDATAFGGTTTIVLDAEGQMVSHVGSLAGTSTNCAGGLTPWNSWLTCEETFEDGDTGVRHGYVFEVPIDGEGSIEPFKDMGRFSHEAVCIDPATTIVYLTEDRGDSLLYRFRPNIYGDYRSGGVLEALKLRDFPDGVNTGEGFRDRLFQPMPVEWVAIDVVDPDTEDNGNSTRAQGQAKGAAVFSRGEGAWWGNGKAYIVATNGGDDGAGQVWAYNPTDDTLTLFVESIRDPNDPALADNEGFLVAAPDNVTVGPNGRLFLCEDGSGIEKVVAVNTDGSMFEVLRNVLSDGEFTGACFSPDGNLMFVNIQDPGLTCVIRGSWA